MSEPASLYARFAIRPEAYQAFRASPVSAPADFPDWAAWSATRPMHGGPLSPAALAEMRSSGETTGAVLDQWLADEEQPVDGNVQEQMDGETWTLTIALFSDNYIEWIGFLSVLRGIAPFLDDEGGAVLVHDYLWGDTDTDVALLFSEGSSRIVDEIPALLLAVARQRLGAHVAEIEEGD